jgi:hypothetical protein
MMKLKIPTTVFITLLILYSCQKTETAALNNNLSSASIASSPGSQPKTPTAPTLPTGPSIPLLTYSVANYGAVPNDNRDDRPAIQKAVDALIAAGGGTLAFPSGVYNLTIDPASGTYKHAITLGTGKIRLAPQNGANVTIKLNNNQGPYYCMFNAQNTVDVSIENITVDQNGLNNQITLSEITGGAGGAVIQTSVRQIFAFSGAEKFKVDRCTFDNVMGVWVIFNSTGSDATITNNKFVNVGGANYDYDVSVIYTDCDRALVGNNTITGRTTGAKGARTALEIHGNDQTITNNTISSMVVGINVVGEAGKVSANTASRHSYTNNIMKDVYNGFEFWIYMKLYDVLIANNQITLNVDKFFYAGLPDFEAGQYAPPYGISLKDWNAEVFNLKIANNNFTFTNFSKVLQEPNFSAATYSAGISLATTSSTAMPINDLTVTDNTVTNSLSSGFYSFISLNTALVKGNTFNNPGLASNYSGTTRYSSSYWDAFTVFHQSGAYCWTKGNAKVKNVVISSNKTNNVVSPNVVKYGTVGTGNTGGSNCSLSANTVTGSNNATPQFKGNGWN